MNVATWLYTVNSRYTVFTVFTVVTRGQLLQIMQLNCSALPLSTLHTHDCHGKMVNGLARLGPTRHFGFGDSRIEFLH